MPKLFDMLKSSTPTSRAPSAARKLSGRRPSKTRSPYAKSCTTAAHERRFRPRDDCDLPLGIELDPVDVSVALGDRVLELGQPTEGRVSVLVVVARGLDEAADDDFRRRNVGIAAAEIHERLASLASG